MAPRAAEARALQGGTVLRKLQILAKVSRHCVDLGVDIRFIAEALGHESLESTKIYTQVSFQRTCRIAELFGSPGG